MNAFAWDAVGIFHEPDKVVVLINERTSGSPGKLMGFTDLFDGHKVDFTSEEGNIRIVCTANTVASGCTMRFQPGANVTVGEKSVDSSLPIEAFKKVNIDPEAAPGLDISFENSNGDTFRLWIHEDQIHFAGGKR